MRILFLCLGNICRSPAAEGVFREMAARAGLEVEADSAGTSDWHLGEPPYGPMLAAAQARGYDLNSLRARQLTRDDFERFDLILAMDEKNIAKAETIRPATSRAHLRLFLDMETGTQDVPDPYYTRDFDGCLELIEDGARRLIGVLQPPQ